MADSDKPTVTQVTLNIWHCVRCGHKWISRKMDNVPPRQCARCRSGYWNVEPKSKSARVKKQREPKPARVSKRVPISVEERDHKREQERVSFDIMIPGVLLPPPGMDLVSMDMLPPAKPITPSMMLPPRESIEPQPERMMRRVLNEPAPVLDGPDDPHTPLDDEDGTVIAADPEEGWG